MLYDRCLSRSTFARLVCASFLTTILIACQSPSVAGKRSPKQGAGQGADEPELQRRGAGDFDPDGNGTSTRPSPGPRVDESFTLTDDAIADFVADHQAQKGSEAQYYGYVHVPPSLFEDKYEANMARIAAFKVVNHVSNAPVSYTGEDISDGRGAVYAIDTRVIWPNQNIQKWNLVKQPIATGGEDNGGLIGAIAGFFQNRDNGVRVKGDIISVGNMQLANVDTESIPADRFVYNATFPNVYNYLINTPGGARGLVRREGVTSELKGLAAHKNAIVNGPRVSAFWETQDGRHYISTGDYFANFEGREIPYVENDQEVQFRNGTRIPSLPGGTSVVSESYLQDKNGCIKYYIWGAGTQERGRAEKVFVEDPQNHSQSQYGYLVTGRSCMSCHINGAQSAPSDMPQHVASGKIEQGRWSTNEDLDLIYKDVTNKFRQDCMKPVIDKMSNGDTEWNERMLNGLESEPVLHMVRKIEPERSRRRGP